MDAVGRIRATFRAAEEFGLRDEQIWSTVTEVCDRVPADAPIEDSLDELIAALARRVLEASSEESHRSRLRLPRDE
jgi:hypothetical protein